MTEQSKDARAIELRKAGATFDQIASQLGFDSIDDARKVVVTALKALANDDTDTAVTLEVARLDTLMVALWARARTGDYGAVDRVLRIMERRARLLGLDPASGRPWLPDERPEPDAVDVLAARRQARIAGGGA